MDDINILKQIINNTPPQNIRKIIIIQRFDGDLPF